MAVKNASGKIELMFKIVLFCLLGFSVILGSFLTGLAKNASDKTDEQAQYIENWTVTDEKGNSFKTGRVYKDDRAYSEDFTIVARLPDTIGADSVLCFQNRSNVEVYINGRLRKSFDMMQDTGIPRGSMKEFYIQIPLTDSDAGAELRIIKYRTEWNPLIVSETFVTTAYGVHDYLIGKYGVSFALTVVLLVASLLTAAVAVVMRIWNRQRINMLYAALGILNVACWLISVSQLTPSITGIYYVDGVMGFIFCMMMPFAFIIYMNSITRYRYARLYNVLYIVSLLNLIVWTILHFSGIRTFQESIVFIDSVLGLVILSAIVCFAVDIRGGYVKDYRYTAIGFLVFMVMAIIEILSLLITEDDINQIFMIAGLLSMLVMVVFQQVDDIRREKNALEAEVRKKQAENEQLLIHIVQTLTGTIDAKDTYTKGHSGRVALYSKEIARRFGYDEAKLNDIYIMALLHDIGKIGVPDAVINKPGRLTQGEYEIIRKHPVMGAKILSNITEKEDLSVGAKWHHEKYGGGGYPDGLKGDEIPEPARIIAVADAYDAMTSYRSYRDPMPQKRVAEEIEKGKGTQFDPAFADIMLEMISEDKKYELRERKS